MARPTLSLSTGSLGPAAAYTRSPTNLRLWPMGASVASSNLTGHASANSTRWAPSSVTHSSSKPTIAGDRLPHRAAPARGIHGQRSTGHRDASGPVYAGTYPVAKERNNLVEFIPARSKGGSLS